MNNLLLELIDDDINNCRIIYGEEIYHWDDDSIKEQKKNNRLKSEVLFTGNIEDCISFSHDKKYKIDKVSDTENTYSIINRDTNFVCGTGTLEECMKNRNNEIKRTINEEKIKSKKYMQSHVIQHQKEIDAVIRRLDEKLSKQVNLELDNWLEDTENFAKFKGTILDHIKYTENELDIRIDNIIEDDFDKAVETIAQIIYVYYFLPHGGDVVVVNQGEVI